MVNIYEWMLYNYYNINAQRNVLAIKLSFPMATRILQMNIFNENIMLLNPTYSNILLSVIIFLKQAHWRVNHVLLKIRKWFCIFWTEIAPYYARFNHPKTDKTSNKKDFEKKKKSNSGWNLFR